MPISDALVGIDEAGRGPVIGPLVLCGVALDPGRHDALDPLPIQDSKAFGSGQRAVDQRREVAASIRALARVALRVAGAAEVDQRVARGELNALERELALQIIDELDAVDATIVADGARIFGPRPVRLWAVHPGGTRILESAARGLGVEMNALQPSLDVFRRNGNMSSATIMFVLRGLLEDPSCVGEPGCAMAFGPGLTVESLRFRPLGGRRERLASVPAASADWRS